MRRLNSDRLRRYVLDRTIGTTYYMGFRTVEKDGLLSDDGKARAFRCVKTPRGYWCADPLLFEWDGEIYLFCEMYNKTINRGCIGVAKYNSEKGLFHEILPIIMEPFHMSFPYIFQYNGDAYMIPETSETSKIRFYKIGNTPYEWHYVGSIFTEGKCCDSVTIEVDGNLWIICTEQDSSNPLCNKVIIYNIFEIEDGGEIRAELIYQSGTFKHNARNGGPVLHIGENHYRVIQRDDEGLYGSGLIFREISVAHGKYQEKSDWKSIGSNDVKLNVSQFRNEIKGVHTYSRCKNIEVVDFFVYQMTFKGFIAHIKEVITRR